jgi:hypothetical protein
MARPGHVQNGCPDHTYKYVRLQESCLRVFTLLPGNHNAELQASLETVSMQQVKENNACKYEAVSYSWGSKILSRSLRTPEGRIIIPRSLFVALRYLRYPDQPRRLWADCVCISQTDVEERNRQVAMMPDIFGSALKVLVWLGPSQPDDALAFAVLGYEKQMPHWMRGVEDPIPFLDHALNEQPWCACCKAQFFVRHSPGRAGLIAAKRLLHRAWFSRVWTLQEVCGVLSRVTIHSGNHIASLGSLRNSFHRLHDIQRVTERRYVTNEEFDRVGLLHQVSDVYLADQLLKRPEDTINVMIRLMGRHCSDPRDRIFAVRGLLGIQNVLSLRPDYTLHAVHVYRRFVAHLLIMSFQQNRRSHEDSGLHVAVVFGLCTVSCHDSKDHREWSSWVPDFDTLSLQAERKQLLYTNHTYMEVGCRPELWPFSRSGRRFRAVPASEDSSTLLLKGHVFGNVKAILKLSAYPKKVADLGVNTSDYGAVNLEVMSKLLKWHQAVCTFLQTHLNGRDLYCRESDSLIRSFLACGVESGESAVEKFRAVRLLENCLRATKHTEQYIDAHRLQYRLAPVISTNYFRFAHLDRVAAIIEMPESRKKLAWVPASSLEGDQACICPGAPFPFILRAAEGGMYRLQGDFWVHDIGEAEALGAPITMTESYELLGSRHKSWSRWWTGAMPEGMDFTGSDSAEDAVALEWEEENVGNILLC